MTIQFFKRFSTVTMLTCLPEAYFVIVQELIVEHTAIHSLAKLIVSVYCISNLKLNVSKTIVHIAIVKDEIDVLFTGGNDQVGQKQQSLETTISFGK